MHVMFIPPYVPECTCSAHTHTRTCTQMHVCIMYMHVHTVHMRSQLHCITTAAGLICQKFSCNAKLIRHQQKLPRQMSDFIRLLLALIIICTCMHLILDSYYFAGCCFFGTSSDVKEHEKVCTFKNDTQLIATFMKEVCTYECMYVCIMHSDSCVCVHACTCVHVHVYVQRTCVYVYTCVYMCVCVCVCVCISTYQL